MSVQAQLNQVTLMVSRIERILPENATEWDKIEAIQTFLHQPGLWNDFNPYGYDHDDPLGQDPTNQLLSHYLTNRKGNCGTMPFLFIILGQRLG